MIPITGIDWPTDHDGLDLPIKYEEKLGLNLCKRCWNQDHPKGKRCPIPQCQCGRYVGRNKGLGRPHTPHKDCKENQELPDVGTITV